MLEEERRRREEAEKRLQEETVHRQQLVDKEVKMRSKNFSQVRLRPDNNNLQNPIKKNMQFEVCLSDPLLVVQNDWLHVCFLLSSGPSYDSLPAHPQGGV